MDFVQTGVIKDIKTAPILRGKGQFSIQCVKDTIQKLQCCVQKQYQVQWWNSVTEELLTSGNYEVITLPSWGIQMFKSEVIYIFCCLYFMHEYVLVVKCSQRWILIKRMNTVSSIVTRWEAVTGHLKL